MLITRYSARWCPSSDPERCRCHGHCLPTCYLQKGPPSRDYWRQNAEPAVCFASCPTAETVLGQAARAHCMARAVLGASPIHLSTLWLLFHMRTEATTIHATIKHSARAASHGGRTLLNTSLSPCSSDCSTMEATKRFLDWVGTLRRSVQSFS